MPEQRRGRTRRCCGVAALSPSCRVVAFLLLLLALGSCWAGVTAAAPTTTPTRTSSSSHLQRLFNALDRDADGQLRKNELRQYIDTQHLSPEGQQLDGAVDGVIDALDSPDVGLGVSPLELEQHLHTLLQGVQVADWVAHGLGLPQYADAFRANAITMLDLPMLINDGGKLLQTELQVASPLHRQKLLRAMQRQILGLGAAPGPLQHLHCSSTSSSSGQHAQATPTPLAAGAGAVSGVVCSWQPPADPGQPVMHKYLLQRVEHSAASAAAAAGAASAAGLRWQTVAEVSQDSLSTRVLDVPPRPGVYQYRLAAWNLYGRSPYVLSDDVTVTEQQLAQPQQQQQLLPVAATAAAAAADGVSLVHSMSVPLQAAVQGAQQWHQQWPDSCSSQHLQQHQQSADALVVQQQQQDAVMWGPSSSSSCRSTTSTSSSALGPASQGSPSCPNLQQQQQQLHQQQPGNSVVWVVGLDAEQQLSQGSSQPATAAGRAAQRELAASLGAAAAAAAAAGGRGGAGGADRADGRGPAGLIALLGSAWHSNIGSWVKAVLNSLTAFVLLVLPVCVRLLPVPVLTQAAQVLAWLLHFLPGQARQRLLLRPQPPQQQQQQPIIPAAPSLLAGAAASAVAANPAAAQGPAAAAAATGIVAAAAGAGGSGDAVSNGCADAGRQLAAAAALQDPQQLAALRQRQSRLFFPRSVSEFDLLRGQVGVPPAAAAAAASASTRSSSRSPARSHTLGGSPYRHSSPIAAAGIAQPLGGSPVVGGLRFASTAGVAALLPPGSEAAASLAAARPDQQLLPGSPLLNTAGAADSIWGSSPGAAAAAVEETAAEAVEQELQYALYGSAVPCVSTLLPDNKRCSFPGCQQQFGLRFWKATMQRHYCGRCQQAFCLQHTAYSPHGSSGTCGVQSRCLCIDCFYEYTPEYQSFLASRNTLLAGKRSRSGPPAAAAAVAAAAALAPVGASEEGSVHGGSSNGGNGGSSSSKAGRVLSRLLPATLVAASSSGGGSSSKPQEQQQQQDALGCMAQPGGGEAGSSPQLSQPPPAPSAVAVAAAARLDGDGTSSAACSSAAALDSCQLPARQRSLGAADAADAVPVLACSKAMKSRMLWGRGLTKALGVVRFKHAGDVHHAEAGMRADAAAAAAAAAAAGEGGAAAAGASSQ